MRAVAVFLVAAVAIGGLYWWATGGRRSPEREFSWLTERPIAHRGIHDDEAPENSLTAFGAAADAGYPIELDVHLSSDGVPVVIHDERLARMADDPRVVSEVTAADMQLLSLVGTKEHVPTLDGVLDLVDGRVPLFIEIKNPGDAGALEDAVMESLGGYRGDVAVMSFNPYSLARFADRAPDIPRGQLSGTFEGEDLSFVTRLALRYLLMNWASRPDFVAYELESLTSASARWQQVQGRPLLAWTATSEAERERALRVGDGVICDPDALDL
jgi:glycerophosphoryl diester phosphodiesterase